MRVVNKISFEAKDDADALRLASERLGKDAVILSTRKVRMGGFLGFFQKNVLMVSAGILQDDSKEEKAKDKGKDDAVARERLVAFQKLLEFKQAAETSNGLSGSAVAAEQLSARQKGVQDGAKIIYSPQGIRREAQEFDSVHLSREGLETVSRQEMPTEDKENRKLREEVEELSRRLDTVLSHLDRTRKSSDSMDFVGSRTFEAGLPGVLTTMSRNYGEIESDEFCRKLIASEVEADYARRLVEEYRMKEGREPFEKWLASRIHCASSLPGDAMGGRKVMLLGPTGVGKTTTIAKLAAIQALWKHRNVLLLTSDTYRIAAVDQLRTYARILGVPIEVIFEAENFAGILETHANAELILLDTAGRGPRDRKNLEAFETLYNVFKPDAVHLVLAANMKYRDMLDVVERMSIVPVSHVIFTKLDETISYGALFSVLPVLDRPISFFTTGQNVPNDIEVASGARLAELLLGGENERARHEPN
ncbi:MAG: flagellar biosynthesis protein FlhF [Synergistaceae bacterium]|jgi:flagellar biosynthesis protein FlhF|nr:flagellar biosynthesis protein FlhF [Synergistaceae bacterium]